MKILAINGSPKGNRSNTWRLTSAFLEGISAKEESSGSRAHEIETLNIGSLNIKPCLGCFSCWSKIPGECCIHDDMQGVISKILWADVVVWSFPLYYFGLPGQLKTLIDRQLPMSLPFMCTETESGGILLATIRVARAPWLFPRAASTRPRGTTTALPAYTTDCAEKAATLRFSADRASFSG